VQDAITGFGKDTIMDFTIYPFGNAQETQNPDGSYSFSCQHGANECKGNMVEACAMHFHNATADWWPFVYCLEKGDPATGGQACAKQVGWTDWDAIDSCTTSSLGNGLMHDVATATGALSPPHQWTPWVVMNGKPLTESQLDESLIKVVCDAYTGTKPAACNQFMKTSETKCMRDMLA